MTRYEQLVAEHLDRGCSPAVAHRAARFRLEEAGLWDALLHPRGRAGEFATKGGLERVARTRSGREIRVRPYETNREEYLRRLIDSKAVNFTQKQIARLKHIKNVLKDPDTPKNIKAELVVGAAGLLFGQIVPIPFDELLWGGLISHALKRSRGESAVPFAGRVGEVATGTGLISPGATHQHHKGMPETAGFGIHTHHRAGHEQAKPRAPMLDRRPFKVQFAG